MRQKGHREELILKKNEDRRVLAGHRWIFSNEIQNHLGPIPPMLVDVRSESGRILGTGIYNPHSLISVRLLEGPVSSLGAYLKEKLVRAITMRQEVGGDQDEGRRLVHSEADGLPGIVVDQYGEYLSLQITTKAFDAFSSEIIELLKELLSPKGIRVDRSVRIREAEGLEVGSDQMIGEIPSEISVRLGGREMHFSLSEGQKTGLFLDQKDNVRILAPILARKRVLDGFCYVGGWSAGIQSAASRDCGGKRSSSVISGVDASERAIHFYQKNVPGAHGIVSEFAPWAKGAIGNGERFDSVILDPPAFIKSRKLIREGIEGYHAVFRLGVSLLEKKGVFVACSCSALLSWDDFFGILRSIFQKEGRQARMIYQGRASWDHPRILAMPELDYLKCAAFWVENRQ